MAFNPKANLPSQSFQQPLPANYGSPSHIDPRPLTPTQFDVITWYPKYQSCLYYFVDHAQHSRSVQGLAAFLNIQLPSRKQPFPLASSASSSPPQAGASPDLEAHLRQPNPFTPNQNAAYAQAVTLIPYIRRLVATGHDSPAVLRGFFGDDWKEGVGSLHEIERGNYLFAAKSTSWLKVKEAYDMSPEETIPFLSPLKDVSVAEIQSAESRWSDWLAMQDWMLGPRAP
jgi:hypothetical protein